MQQLIFSHSIRNIVAVSLHELTGTWIDDATYCWNHPNENCSGSGIKQNVCVREYVIHGANDSVLHLWTWFTECKYQMK